MKTPHNSRIYIRRKVCPQILVYFSGYSGKIRPRNKNLLTIWKYPYCFLFNKRELHSFYEFTTTSLLGNIHTKVKQCQSLSIRLFQFTQSSNRVCLRPATLLLATGGFNPCTHTGYNKLPHPFAAVQVVSIHASIQGATIKRVTTYTREWRFNPRTHTGCDGMMDRR